MVDPLTISIISLVALCIGAVCGIGALIVNITNTLRARAVTAKQQEEFDKARDRRGIIIVNNPNLLVDRYTLMAYIMHLSRDKSHKTIFVPCVFLDKTRYVYRLR